MSNDVQHRLTMRIFNFCKETNHRFPSAIQDEQDEQLLNRLIIECIGSRRADWNDTGKSYINPYTPIKPSKVHVSQLHTECVAVMMNFLKSLEELVEMASVCPDWVVPVTKVIGDRYHSLKVFDFEGNIEMYQEAALMQYNLARLDMAAGVQQTGDRKEDRIFVRSYCGDKNNPAKKIMEAIFVKTTYLVLNTVNINQADLIRKMKKLTSITLFEPPESSRQQIAIWEALNAAPELRHVHIFYSNGDLSFKVDKMDFLTRIESFTLDNYRPDNLFAILKRLGPKLRCLQIGPFEQGDEVLEKLIEQNPKMVANLTQLSVRLDEMSMEKATGDEPYEERYLMHKKMLKLIVENFPELTYLDLEFASLMYYNDIINRLQQLPKLTELRFASRANTDSGFAEWPSSEQRLELPDDLQQAQALPNVSKVYMTINNPNEDYPFLRRLFYADDGAVTTITNVFPGIEQATFVLKEVTFDQERLDHVAFLHSLRETIQPQYWLRLRVYNVTRGTMNRHFFARNEYEVRERIRVNAFNPGVIRDIARNPDEEFKYFVPDLNAGEDDDDETEEPQYPEDTEEPEDHQDPDDSEELEELDEDDEMPSELQLLYDVELQSQILNEIALQNRALHDRALQDPQPSNLPYQQPGPSSRRD